MLVACKHTGAQAISLLLRTADTVVDTADTVVDTATTVAVGQLHKIKQLVCGPVTVAKAATPDQAVCLADTAAADAACLVDTAEEAVDAACSVDTVDADTAEAVVHGAAAEDIHTVAEDIHTAGMHATTADMQLAPVADVDTAAASFAVSLVGTVAMVDAAEDSSQN